MSALNVDAGLCACRARVVRGEADDGSLVVANVRHVDAAEELLAWAAGRRSYVLAFAHKQLTLTPRTSRDIKRRPAGFKRDAIVLAHECRLTTEGDT